jgi:hypothetical protein
MYVISRRAGLVATLQFCISEVRVSSRQQDRYCAVRQLTCSMSVRPNTEALNTFRQRPFLSISFQSIINYSLHIF